MKIIKINSHNALYNFSLIFLIAPTLVSVILFSYAPAVEGIRHALYLWDGSCTEEYIGFEHVWKLLGPSLVWIPLLMSLLSVFITLMVEKPLIKKIFKIISLALYALTLVCITLYSSSSNIKFSSNAMDVFYILLISGVFLLCLSMFVKNNCRGFCTFSGFAFPLVAFLFFCIKVAGMGDIMFWMSFRLVFILVLANLVKIWPGIFTAVCIHRLKSDKMQYLYRVLFVIPMIIPVIVMLLLWKFFFNPNSGILNNFLISTGLDRFLIFMDTHFLNWNVFTENFKPVWLGNTHLIIPSLIFWGFPWVGTVGVLIYLAGLQNIGNEIYEAAEIDGVGSWGKFAYIEFPLIMTQVRLNLILMIIGTFQSYGFQLLLFGPDGGAGNKAMTTGLYMYNRGFIQMEFGYACAIGVALFIIIMALTLINQKYVRSNI